jgi:hypothetical protein
MASSFVLRVVGALAAFWFGLSAITSAAPKPKGPPPPSLSPAGDRLQARYTQLLAGLRTEITKALPPVDERDKTALTAARERVKAAAAQEKSAAEALGKVATAKALVDHAKGKWIGGADKGIAQAEAALRKATTDAERAAANKDLAKWQENKAAGLQALKERQEALDRAKVDEPKLKLAHQAARQALDDARANESKTAAVLLDKASPFLSSGAWDAKLAAATVLAHATPRGLAEFAQRGPEQEALVEKLLANPDLMKQMLEAGGAVAGRYGQAFEIYTAIQKASVKARDGHLQRLALGVSLEHAMPIEQSARKDSTLPPGPVDPVKRYLHYEKADAAGELDPAFKSFSAWEYRMIVDCDAPDEMLAWGRDMLRNYRPDHVANPDYGWRYSGIVRTDVSYGSQNVHCDLASLHNYQNIIRNGGVCGRRAFFGRFILKSFGMPTWGVTQHKHAAVSHWTPKGWVVNLGAGFHMSWWDKDDAPRSGSDFLLETQARAHAKDFQKVLRAQWISQVLGEIAYNDRKAVAGGFWSNLAHYQTAHLAASAVELGPLGQELSEANESAAHKSAVIDKPVITDADRKVVVRPAGVLTIPAPAISGASVSRSSLGGYQLFCGVGAKLKCEVDVPRAGKYALTARVVTVHDPAELKFAINNAAPTSAIRVPYTCGAWQQTAPAVITLSQGKNTLVFSPAVRAFALKEFTLTPVQ